MKKKQIRDRTGLKQISFDIPEKVHQEIKEYAKQQHLTMKQWIILAMGEKRKREKALGFK